MSILESAATESGSDPAGAASLTLASVLVIDDDGIVSSTLCALLEAEGFNAVSARSGKEGVDLLRGWQFQVVMVDLVMPGMDGIQTIAALKEIDPDIEVIVLTGYATVESTIAALRQGAGDFLLKPISMAKLRPALLRALEKRRGDVVRAQAQARAVIGAAPEAIVLFDREGLVREFNPHAEQIFGWSREQAVGRKIADLIIPPRLLEGFQRHVEAAARQGKRPLNGSLEVVALREDGEEFPVELSTVAIETPQGILLCSFIRDITERKLADKTLQESEAKLKAIFDTVQTGILIIDPDSHRIVDVNPAALRMIAAPCGQVVGAECHNFICLAQQGRCPVSDLGQTMDNSERVLLTATGEKRAIIKTVVPLVIAGHKHLLESFVDISAYKRAEEALRESEDRHRDLVENSLFLIGTHDAKGRILGFNRAAAVLMEVTNTEEMVGRPLTDYVPPGFLPKFDEYLETILRQGHAEGLMVIATPSGNVKVVEYQNTLRRQDSEEPIIRMVGRDVTEKMEAEKAQAFLTSMVESSQDSIIGITLEGTILSWNHGAEDLYGYSAKEMTGKPISVLFPPELLNDLSQHLEKIRRGESVSGYESVRVCKDGRQLEVALTISPVFDATGEITCAVSIGHGIAERKRAERALKERTAYFETLFAANPLGIAVIDDQGCVEMCNPAFEALFQYSHADIKGGNLSDLIAPSELLAESRDLVKRVLSGYILSVTTRRRRRDGTLVDVEVHVFPLAMDGKVVGVIGLYQDITKRKHAEEALGQAEEHFRSLFASIPVPTFFFDTETLQYIEVNDAATTYSGYSRDELLKMRVTDLVPSEIAPIIVSKIQAHRPHTRNRDQGLHRLKNGQVVDVEIDAHALDFHGRSTMLTVIQDVTARKRADEARAFLASLVESSQDAIIGTTLEGVILSWNHGAEGLYGYGAEEMIGKFISEVFRPERAGELPQYLEKIRRGERVSGHETIRVRKDGSRLDVALALAPVYDKVGKITGIVSVAHDITQRKRADEQTRLQTAALESAANGIVITDREGRIIWANPAFTRLTGYPIEEVLGRTSRTLKSGKHDAAFYKNLWQTILSGGVWQGELINRRKDGTLYTEQMTITPVRDTGGDISHFIAIKQDVTERQRAEEALRASEERYRLLFEQNLTGVFRCTMDGRLLDCNTAYAHILGYDSRQEALDLVKAAALANPADLEIVQTRLVKARLVNKKALTSFEVRLRRKDQALAWVLGNISTMEAGEGEEPVISGMLIDITPRKQAEQDLAQERELLRALMDTVPDHIYFKDLQGRIIRTNLAHAKAFGLSDAAQAVGKTDFDVFTVEHARQGYDDEQKIINTREPMMAKEEEITWPDGRVTWVSTTKMPLQNAYGMVIGTFGVSRDITESKRTENELQQSRQMLRSILDTIPQRVFWKDRNLVYMGCNQALAQDAGVQDPVAIIGKTDFDLSWGRTAEFHRADDKLVMERESPKLNFEEQQSRPDGTSLWLRTCKLPLRDRESRVIGVIGTYEDITERKLAEEELLFKTALLEAESESTIDGILVVDRTAHVLQVNKQFADLMRLPEDLAHTTDDTKILEYVVTQMKDPDTFLERVHYLYAHESECTGREEIDLKDGRVFDRYSAPLQDAKGKYYGRIWYFRDITELKLAEKMREAKEAAEAASRVKSQFLASMSHETRTPINGVIGMTKVLLNTALSAEQQHYAQVACTCGETLLALINDILDLSKIEAGKLSLEVIDFDLHMMLERTVEMLAMPASQKGLELTCLVAPETPSLVRGDPARLRQILLNLAGNALKFTQQGEVGIRIKPDYQDEKSVTLRFAVEDTGIGIAKDRIGALFSPFVQADDSTTRKYGGTGLGLAISKQLVELMGGQIGVESEEGEGSTFWFTVVQQKQETPGTPDADTQIEFEGVKVLVVDDNATNRMVLGGILKSWGCRMTTAADGDSALVILRKAVRLADPFDVALLDMEMSGMDGIELGRQITADSQLTRTALLLMTNAGRGHKNGSLEECGGALYVAKPVMESHLCDAMNVALGRKKQTNEPAGPNTLKQLAPGRTDARILVAEDIASNRDVALAILTMLGYHPDLVTNGAEALAAIQSAAYDLILMDCEMPEMDGYEATRRIRTQETSKGKSRMPIVALTAHAISGDQAKCMEAGMDDYLRKPIEPQELVEALRKWLPASLPPVSQVTQSNPQAKPPNGVFNEEELLARLMGNRTLAGKVVARFMQDAPAMLQQLSERLEAGDAVETHRRAHGMKGAASTVSAGALRDAALKVEEAALAGDLASADQLLPSLDEKLEQLRAALQAAGWA